jgi:hypothetical protein
MKAGRNLYVFYIVYALAQRPLNPRKAAAAMHSWQNRQKQTDSFLATLDGVGGAE